MYEPRYEETSKIKRYHTPQPALSDRNNVDMKIVDGLIGTKISFDHRSHPLQVASPCPLGMRRPSR